MTEKIVLKLPEIKNELEVAKDYQPIKKEVVDEIDPATLIAKLKQNEAQLDKLSKLGGNAENPDINDLKERVALAIRQLSQILEDPEIDQLSDKAIG